MPESRPVFASSSYPKAEPWRENWDQVMGESLEGFFDLQPSRRLLEFIGAARTLHESLSWHYRPEGLNEHRFAVLVTLLGEDPTPLTPTALAKATGLTAPSMTKILDDLERLGWAERTRTGDNRRIRPVRLTRSGKTRVRTAAASLAVLSSELLRGLPQDDQATLDRILLHVRAQAARLVADTARIQPATTD